MKEGDLFTVSSPNEDTTRALAGAVARESRNGDCILLSGDLGAGKTVFARGFIQAFLPDQEVTSPTFNLVQTYPAKIGTISHFDLYRLKSEAELAEIGLEDALSDGVTLIEWPKLAENQLPQEALDVAIRIGNNPEERIVVFSGPSAVWRERLTFIKKAYA